MVFERSSRFHPLFIIHLQREREIFNTSVVAHKAGSRGLNTRVFFSRQKSQDSVRCPAFTLHREKIYCAPFLTPRSSQTGTNEQHQGQTETTQSSRHLADF